MSQPPVTMDFAHHTCCKCGQEFVGELRARTCKRCLTPKVRKKRPINRELTVREKQVVALIARGRLNKEIAWKLKLSEGTIKIYVSKILAKEQVSNRTELAVRYAHSFPETELPPGSSTQ